jgi:hypothetical protein
VSETSDQILMLQGEVKRLRHIINVLRWRIQMPAIGLDEVENNVRVNPKGEVEVFSFGEWVKPVGKDDEIETITHAPTAPLQPC